MKENAKSVRSILGIATIAVLFTGAAQASPVAAAWNGMKRCAAAVSEKCGLKTAGKVAIRGGTEYAAAKTAWCAARKESVRFRPGQILAVGGATAAVVGTHEVADGQQSALAAKGDAWRAAGDAVRNNPDAAVRVLCPMSRPITLVGGVVAFVVAAMLLWAFFPLVAAFRSRLAQKVRAPAPAGTEPSSVVSDTAFGFARSGFTFFETLLVLAGFVILTAFGVRGCVSGTTTESSDKGGEVTTSASKDDNKKCAEFEARLSECTKEYLAAQNRHYEEFEKAVPETVAQAYAPVTDVIPYVKQRYSGFGKIAHLAKTMVVDKFRKKNEMAKEVEADLKSCYYPAIFAAQEKAFVQCTRLNEALERERSRYVSNVKTLMIKLPDDMWKGFEAARENSAAAINAVQDKLSSAQEIALLAGGIEAVCIRSTITTIARPLAKTVARQAGTMAASAGAACADGPSPLFDAIGAVATVGCTLWSAYDIYRATKTVPDELERTLIKTTDDCRCATEKSVLDCGAALFEAYVNEAKTSR